MTKFDCEMIKKRRKELKLTQESLAKSAGLTREHLVEIERGRSYPKVTTLAKIANVLNVDMNYFFNHHTPKSCCCNQGDMECNSQTN